MPVSQGANIARTFIQMLLVFTPQALRNLAQGWHPSAYPGRAAVAPRVAAETTRQPRAMLHNAFGVALVWKVSACRPVALGRAVTEVYLAGIGACIL